MKFLDVMWIGSGSYGIVKVETEDGHIRYYGGPTQTSPEEDIRRIMDWGSTISPEAMIAFFQR
jgi:hypothetical protein